jgi:hypothetical protein
MGEMHLMTPTDLNCPFYAWHGMKLQREKDEGQRGIIRAS